MTHRTNNPTDARSQIMGQIRANLGKGDAIAGQWVVEERLRSKPAGIIPARSKGSAAEQQALFCKMAEAAAAQISEIDDLAELGPLLAKILANYNAPAACCLADHPLLRNPAIDWPEAVDCHWGAIAATMASSLSVAGYAVAETGTLVMLSGPQSPSNNNFLAENHLVLLPRSAIKGSYEAVWEAMAAQGQAMPRTINLITGPSRTGDIEQKIELGAHGPLRLHIIVWNDAGL